MKEYTYNNVQIGKFFFSTSANHRDIINEYAAQGWRYVGYIPTQFTSNGGTKAIELIFEREAD